jgi:predicted outer membrane repeat protein
MTRWIRQLFRRTPTAPVVRQQRACLGLQRLEERETPATFNVTTTADSGAGSLRVAVALANTNPEADTITFATGLGPVVLSTAELLLTDTSGATTISGPSGGAQVVQRSTAGGTPNFRLFNVGSGVTAAFNNLTITNGNTTVDGGGIFNSGTVTVTNSTVSGNTATTLGGGIYNGSTLTVTNSTVSGNTASTFGGGLVSIALATVTNSTISGNTAKNSGGAIASTNTVTLTNVTITGNRSDSDDAGAETGGGLFPNGGTATLNNTLIAGNFRGTGTTRDDVSGAAVVAASKNNLIGDGTNLTGITNGSQGNQIGTGAAPIDPLLQPLANNGGVTRTHALGQNSPALGKGSTTVANYSVFDQRGASRDNGTPDIGAFEVNHPLAPVGVPTTLGGMFQPKPSASANEAFVKGLYQSTLLRAPDTAGLNGWVSQLNGGTPRNTVANGFVNSTENRRNQVTFFYRYFLSREPDTAGLNGWVSQLQAGADEGQVMTGFILSNEFSGQNNNSQFVNLMYYALLSRQADTAGFNGWVNSLNGGQSRGIVVNAFLRSEEGLNRVIDSLFQTYLKRYGSAGDLGAFRTFLNTNTFGQAAILILGSPEFFTNAGNNLS